MLIICHTRREATGRWRGRFDVASAVTERQAIGARGTDGLAAAPGCITADPRLAHTEVLILITFDLDEYDFEALRAEVDRAAS